MSSLLSDAASAPPGKLCGLPDEIWVEILSYLVPQVPFDVERFRELVRLGAVCRRMYLLTRDPVLWQHVVIFGKKDLDAPTVYKVMVAVFGLLY